MSPASAPPSTACKPSRDVPYNPIGAQPSGRIGKNGFSPLRNPEPLLFRSARTLFIHLRKLSVTRLERILVGLLLARTTARDNA